MFPGHSFLACPAGLLVLDVWPSQDGAVAGAYGAQAVENSVRTWVYCMRTKLNNRVGMAVNSGLYIN